MIIKVMDFETVVIKVPIVNPDGTMKYVDDILPTAKFTIIRKYVSHINEFSEYTNKKGKIYKSRAILKDNEGGWAIVQHSFNELQNLANRYKIVGFMKHSITHKEDEPSFEKIKKNGKQRTGPQDKRTGRKPKDKCSSSKRIASVSF